MSAPATVLVADDHASVRDNIARALRAVGLQVVFASDGERALATCREAILAAAVLDGALPRHSGREVCRLLRASDAAYLPVIVLAGPDWDAAERAAALREGADDVVAKDLNLDELAARVEALVRMRTALAGGMPDEATAPRRAKRSSSDLGRDSVTGAWSAGYLDERLEPEVQRASRHNEPLSLMVLDIDSLVGRPAPDAAMAMAAEALARCARGTDVIARCRALSFAVILPNTHFAGAMATAERVWRELGGLTAAGDGGATLSLRASIGIACFPNRSVKSGRELLDVAQQALARARAEGPAHVCLVQHQAYVFQPA